MLARTVQSCLNEWQCQNGRFVSVMRWRATPPCNRSCAGALDSAGFFAARLFLGCARARGHRTAATPTKAHAAAGFSSRASHSRPGIRMRMWVQCSPMPHSSMPAGQRRGEPGWLAVARCAAGAAAGGGQPGLGLGLISAAMEANSHPHRLRRARMRMPARECKALELNPPRALLLAWRQCDGLAYAHPRKKRAAHAKTQQRPELPAELRL